MQQKKRGGMQVYGKQGTKRGLGQMGRSQSRGTGYFFLASPSVITRTHFPEGRCTC